MTEQEASKALRLPVTPVNVFGEPAVATDDREFRMETVFRPSRGLTPSFGPRSSDYEDGEHYLYILDARALRYMDPRSGRTRGG
jgi:hypothetical protein